MGKLSSTQFKVFQVDGVSMLGAKPKSVTDKVTNVIEGNAHGLGDSWEESSATGMLRASFAQTGAYFDTTTGGFHDAWKDLSNVVRTVVYAIAGNTIGALFTGLKGAYAGTYEVIGNVGNLVKANATYAVSGQIDRGLILQDATAKTADWTSAGVDYTTDLTNIAIPITSNSKANPTVITCPVPHKLTNGDKVLISGVTGSSPTINGERVATVITATTFSVPVDTSGAGSAGTGGQFVRASSNNGGVGYLSVTAASGFTNFVGKIQHSNDDGSVDPYTDLITFTDNVSAPFAERLTVAGTVKRWTRFSGDVTGTGSITPFVGFKRNSPQ